MRLFILIAFVIQSCSFLEQKDLVETKDLGQTSSGNIVYKLYQTGIDNYVHEFYVVKETDTSKVFESYLNDATYKSINFAIEESADTTKIKSNRNLGRQSRKIGGKIFTLMYKK